jgi:hypothetical protein
MPKVEIDYSNTIIYKITCNDSNISDKYVGHTTNFVQRKHSHKNNCYNQNSQCYKLKLYETIRQNGGWSNWKMEIINFFNCKDHYEARIKEQEYFELLNANLNSIDPVPKPKIKNVVELNIKQHIYCETCNVKFTNLKLFETHNATKKHLNKTNNVALFSNQNLCSKYFCEKCDYHTSKKSNYDEHLLTEKHKLAFSLSKFICKKCSKIYMDNSGLWRHKKKCFPQQHVLPIQEPIQEPIQASAIITIDVLLQVLKQNEELQKLLIEQTSKFIELAK